MPDDQGTRQGYLVLADIAGYTKFLTGTELEHGQAIIDELISLIRGRLVPPLRFLKLEGDAVVCYAEGSEFTDGERLTELLEVCYFDFSSRLFDLMQSRTCPCVACASMGTLDLKFVAHYGTFLVRRVDRAHDLAGPDVILAHRLLKNTVTERTGCRAYVWYTDACLERLPPPFAQTLPEHRDVYESFGEVKGAVHELRPVAEEMREARREYVGADTADVDASWVEVPVPPEVIWQYFVDPIKQVRWWYGITAIDNKPNGRGRLAAGAWSHCTNRVGLFSVLRHYSDWRPFSYFTATVTPVTRAASLLLGALTETTEFIPLEGGATLVRRRYRRNNRGRVARFAFWLFMPFGWWILHRTRERLLRLLQEEGVLAHWR